MTTLSQMDLIDYYITPSISTTPLSIATITLNIFVIKFYWKSELTLVPLLYTFIAILDIISAAEIIHQSIVLLLFREGYISAQAVDDNAIIFASLLQICYRCSVFCNLVLAVSRTVMILKPFYQIKIGAVKLACFLYVVPWIVLCGVNIHEFYFKRSIHTYFHWIYHFGTTVGIGLAMKVDHVIAEDFFPILVILPDFLAFLPPVLIIIITCIIQVITLRRSNQFPTSSNQRHVTITVLLMSTLFSICNSPFSFYSLAYVCALITRNTELAEKILDQFHNLLTLFVTVLPMLNAALNPVIIISRSGGMRRQFVELTQNMARWIRRG